MEAGVEPLSKRNRIVAVGACNQTVADEPFDFAPVQFDRQKAQSPPPSLAAAPHAFCPRQWGEPGGPSGRRGIDHLAALGASYRQSSTAARGQQRHSGRKCMVPGSCEGAQPTPAQDETGRVTPSPDPLERDMEGTWKGLGRAWKGHLRDI